LRRIPKHIALPLRFFYAVAGYVEISWVEFNADKPALSLNRSNTERTATSEWV
jgi:hypothetical protein